MKRIQTNIAVFTVWTVVLASFIYFSHLKLQYFQLGLFSLCLIAGTAFDFVVCEWTHVFNRTESDRKEDAPFFNFFSKIEFNFQCYDSNWKNIFWFVGLFIHGLIVFLLVKSYLNNTNVPSDMPAENVVAFFGLLLPYFFHKAYYFAIRIPEFKESVYVYYEKKNEIQSNIEQVSLMAEKISNLQTIPRKFNDWLFETKASFTDKEINITKKDFVVPCINQSWSYKQLMDIIFYQKNQSEDIENFYKTEWDNEIKLFSGNDKLVRTCWEVNVETGSTGSGIKINKDKIIDFSVREFYEEKIKVNGLLIIKRTL